MRFLVFRLPLGLGEWVAWAMAAWFALRFGVVLGDK